MLLGVTVETGSGSVLSSSPDINTISDSTFVGQMGMQKATMTSGRYKFAPVTSTTAKTI